MTNDEELQEELSGFKEDIKNSEAELEKYKNYFADNIKNEMGFSIIEHLSNKKEEKHCNRRKNTFKRWLISLIEKI